MKIELLLLGKTKEGYLEKGIQDYHERLSHYTGIEVKVIKVKRHQGKNEDGIKQYESCLLNGQLSSGSYRIALDSRGKQMSSEGLSTFLGNLEQRGVKKAAFIIGGPLGLAEEQLQKADHVLSFSKMTFTHDMVRLLLLEQLYRAYTIKAGEKYHK